MTDLEIEKEAVDKAARKINALLRLMHKGALNHDQARIELHSISTNSDHSEILFCVSEALKAVETNQENLYKKHRY
jgi:hypothetical protein